jgi:hypothetical protein
MMPVRISIGSSDREETRVMVSLPRGHRRAILFRFAGWATFVGSVSYCGVAFAETWNSMLGNGECAGSLAPTATENAVWLLAIAAATLLFSFLTNRWLVAGLATLGLLAFFITALSFAFGSCGSPRSPTLGDDVWTAILFAGSSVVVAAVLAVPVWFIRAAIASYLRTRREPSERDAAHRYGIPLLFLAGAVVAPIAIVLITLSAFQGDNFGASIAVCFFGGAIALLIGVYVAISGLWRKSA